MLLARARRPQPLQLHGLFSYTGGFSVFAAAGGAAKVTSVDIGKAAVAAVARKFELNDLRTEHLEVAADAFDSVERERVEMRKFDLVITDPPSFAPNEKSVPQATQAYTKIFAGSLRRVREDGLLAASSCSSHISSEAFLEITREAFSAARLRGTVIQLGAQPRLSTKIPFHHELAIKSPLHVVRRTPVGHPPGGSSSNALRPLATARLFARPRWHRGLRSNDRRPRRPGSTRRTRSPSRLTAPGRRPRRPCARPPQRRTSRPSTGTTGSRAAGMCAATWARQR